MEPTATFTSPDSRYQLDLYPREMRMSHWVNAPYIFDNQSNTYIMDLGGYWDASEVKWVSITLVKMKLRHYADGSVTFVFELDLFENKAKLSSAGYRDLLSGSMEGVVEEMARTTELRTIFY
jgi:hypothetical protein